jgi:Na+/proline symporter
MGYLIVVALSLLVGSAVYLGTLRSGGEAPTTVGFEGPVALADGTDARPVEGPGAGYTYLRVGTRGPSWRDRLQGFIGLVILIIFGSSALAFGIYQLGHVINVTVERFLQK